MPSANLADYLAKNYLNATNSSDQASGDFQDSSRPKKKRRKAKDQPDSGLMIADDDDALTLKGSSSRRDDEDDNTPTFETGIKSAEFRKKKSVNWKVVSTGDEPSSNPNQPTSADADTEADRILAEAAAESDQRRREIEDEDAPAIVETEQDEAPKMSSGAKAGLQTAADTLALIEREERERALEKKRSKSRKEKSPEQETIYRDATGRRIDVSMKRAEARAAEAEKRRAEKQAKEDAMGDVQRRERDAAKKDLEEAKFLSLARGADDEQMNDQLRQVQRWDDPMAQYMAEKAAEERGPRDAVATKGTGGGAGGAGAGAGSAKTVAKSRSRVYAGHAPPNRYGIAPGWRWDGVDRGNGFEKDWFQARSRSTRNADLEYQWQMDE
ncbi:Pre-mRNA-splicing factor of RES complex-domain-containing protein [Exophiala viscosa]|uniref:Pre-mRNA-splicing factor of RES complex-domain-containing protein n=1 Tax=Exophiala viscosa TaxID=2486360 RepID=UPI00218E7C18|nr:Pre-mRNA-splicing factor of RES complex-domain-containing protein [Exophiala viscosa]